MGANDILITGGAGFIGSHLAERLLSATEHHLSVVDNFDPFYPRAKKEQNLAGWKHHSRVRFVELDLRDRERLAELYADVRPKTVFHLAAKAGVRPSIE